MANPTGDGGVDGQTGGGTGGPYTATTSLSPTAAVVDPGDVANPTGDGGVDGQTDGGVDGQTDGGVDASVNSRRSGRLGWSDRF